jgi:hypothetical protein
VTANGRQVINQGTLRGETGEVLFVFNIVNAGILDTEAGVRIELVGTFVQEAPTLAWGAGRLVISGGTMDNRNRDVSIGAGGTLELVGGTILGGRISGPGTLRFDQAAALDGVTLAADATFFGIGASTRLRNGVTIEGSTLTVSERVIVLVDGDLVLAGGTVRLENLSGATPTVLRFDGANASGPVGLRGTGEVVLTGTGPSNRVEATADDLLIGAGVTVRNEASGTTVTANGRQVINQGTLRGADAGVGRGPARHIGRDDGQPEPGREHRGRRDVGAGRKHDPGREDIWAWDAEVRWRGRA